MFNEIADIRINRIAICDDDVHFRSKCREMCELFFEECNRLVEISEFSGAEDLIKDDGQFYIIFLDIEMPGLSGIDVKNMLAKTQPKAAIIYITNYTRYMSDAFGKNVYCFLEKPLDYEVFRSAVEKVIDDLTIQDDYLIINYKKIFLSQIIYIKAQDKYVRFVIYGSKPVVVRGCMAEWEEKLREKGFFRCHKSYIINFLWVYSIEQVLTLKNNEILPISRRVRKELSEEYHEFLSDRAY